VTDTRDAEQAAGAPSRAAAAASGAAGPAPVPERLAALREQRDFLLRSLDDLRREHEAGDVDDTDYLALEDDYTGRAARVIRAIEAMEAAPSRRPSPTAGRAAGRAGSGQGPAGRRRRGRTAAVAFGVVAFVVVAGVLVAQATGDRGAGDTATGGIRETNATQMNDAVGLAAEGDYEGAIAVYDDVLADNPNNVEALTFKGWFQFLSGDSEGVVTLIDAVEVDPDYPEAHAFLAVVFQRLGRPETALAELDRLDALDPPSEITDLVAGLREELEAEIAEGPTTTTTAP
jgi:tetratricopeptide (TPR) repeat protein